MRVIAGICKGKPLKSVPGTSTRPTTDKVKEALFNRIGPFFEGGEGMDLYAGSGGLGIEALSRGIGHMTFVDRDPKAVKMLHENVDRCGLHGEASIYRNDVHRALKVTAKRGMQFSLIFLDPPYHRQKLHADIHKIVDFGLLTSQGRVVVEHHKDVVLGQSYGGLWLEGTGVYGDKTVISTYRHNIIE